MTIFTAKEFVDKLRDVATNYKTLYVNGCFGAPMTEANKKRYIEHSKYNQKAKPRAAIEAASADTFGMDCVCLIKSCLWNWSGDQNHPYGGATYESNGVEDLSLDAILDLCSDVSTHFGDIVPGEYLWMDGHVGIYIGGGLAVECTAAWDNKVMITTVNNVGAVEGYHARTWKKHGKLPWIDYETLLQRGDKNNDVKILQTYLITLGFDLGESGADGSFGPATQNAIKEYQKSRGYEETGAVTLELFAVIEQEYFDVLFGVEEETEEEVEEAKSGLIIETLEYIIKALQGIVDTLKK